MTNGAQTPSTLRTSSQLGMQKIHQNSNFSDYIFLKQQRLVIQFLKVNKCFTLPTELTHPLLTLLLFNWQTRQQARAEKKNTTMFYIYSSFIALTRPSKVKGLGQASNVDLKSLLCAAVSISLNTQGQYRNADLHDKIMTRLPQTTLSGCQFYNGQFCELAEEDQEMYNQMQHVSVHFLDLSVILQGPPS